MYSIMMTGRWKSQKTITPNKTKGRRTIPKESQNANKKNATGPKITNDSNPKLNELDINRKAAANRSGINPTSSAKNN